MGTDEYLHKELTEDIVGEASLEASHQIVRHLFRSVPICAIWGSKKP